MRLLIACRFLSLAIFDCGGALEAARVAGVVFGQAADLCDIAVEGALGER